MSNDLLSESVNNILDDVETTLCLPILILILLCTLQFIIYDVVDIGCTIYQAVQNFSSSEDACCVVDHVKGLIDDCAKYLSGRKSDSVKSRECPRETKRREDEWDLCDEDDCDC